MRKRKQERNSLDKQIAAAPTFDEQLRLVLAGRARPKNAVERLVRDWQTIRYLRESGNHKDSAFTDFAEAVQKETLNYTIRAMAGNHPEMLVSLAAEMRRENNWKEFPPDKTRHKLLKGLEQGKTLNAIAAESGIDRRAIVRIARKWGVPRGRPGRPKT